MYKRVLLKLSGEALGEKNSSNIIDVDSLNSICEKIKILHDDGIEVAIVIGAGNIWRGKVAQKIGIERVPADYMGMLGTVINAVAMSSALKNLGVESVVYSALPEIKEVTTDYDADKVKVDLSQGKVCFLAGGTGKPFFTTDTASTLRAIETECDAILMAKNGVKGVYDKDPTVYPDAVFYPEITFKEMKDMNIQIMDQTAIDLIEKTDIEILVFSMQNVENFQLAAQGKNVGTICKKER
ncbi:MAG: UMP kinase [Bacilli bacterium]|nr:UMP kinase [Bacilli bacterium]